MEFSSSLLVDLALNVAGFLVAGVLSLTIYSIYTRRQRPTLTPPAEPVNDLPSPPPRATVARPIGTGAGEFITLGSTPKRQTDVATPSGHSRRAQVIQAAREMINAGASSGEIRSAVPVSDAELAVLNHRQNKKHIEER